MSRLGPGGPPGSVRAKTYRVIFEQDTVPGRAFDIGLLVAIVSSVAVVMLESVEGIRLAYGPELRAAEWVLTVLFTIEYAARLWSVDSPRRYALSFFGLIDLFAVIPTYVSLLIPGGQVLTVVRILRVIRVFRVLKLTQYLGEARVLGDALQKSRYKIAVFLVAVVNIAVIVGALMYLVEGPEAGFTSIPRGVYWGIVTLTTVGYGDIAPQSPLGQTLAAMVMIMGYGIIAVPTGIVTAQLTHQPRPKAAETATRVCPACGRLEDDAEADFCKYCGVPISI